MMQLSLTEELVATGVAAAEDAIEQVQRTDGPTVITGCCRIGDTFAWLEHDRDGRLAAPAVRRALDGVRAIAGAEAWAAIPLISDQGTAVHLPLTGPRLLVDALLPGARLGRAEAAALTDVAEALARMLAALHAARPAPEALRPLLRTHPRVRELSALLGRGRSRPQPLLALERLQERLLCDEPDLADELREACLTWERCPASVVLHGTFCPAYVAVPEGALSPSGTRVLGWCDASFGPAAFDLGWMLGELRELAVARAGEPAAAAAIAGLGHAFVRAYLEVSGRTDVAGLLEEADRFAAAKVVSHAVAYVRAFGFDEDAVGSQLRLAASILDGGWAPREGAS